ncbi:MAG: FAD-dependent oxidoreductase [Ignavibacteriales bacterium]|nr:FAD-dependent oxidoreductase [Ignavibacteriales bacterium]
MVKSQSYLTDAQLKAEVSKCEYCEDKPCKEACPADCCPADFLMAIKVGAQQDFRRSAGLILSANPLGGVCGAVCPDNLCMQACVHRTFGNAVKIPPAQATIIRKAKEFGMPVFNKAEPNGLRVAVIGAGPAGLGAASVLAQRGYAVAVYDKEKTAGGMCNLIPDLRLDKKVLQSDIAFLKELGTVRFELGKSVATPESLLSKEKFHAVVVAAGLDEAIALGIPGEEHALSWQHYLVHHKKVNVKGKRVAVIGGGAIAVDCAVTASSCGALSVELLYRRKQEHMPLTQYERDLLLEYSVDVTACTKVKSVVWKGSKVTGVRTMRMLLPKRKKPLAMNFIEVKGEPAGLRRFDVVIVAIGSRPNLPILKDRRIVYAGDLVHGAATVVEAVASGKNAAAQLDGVLRGAAAPKKESKIKSRVILDGKNQRPVSIEADFFGRKIRSPFLLSAAPHSDGYDEMKKAYEAGWAGGVMKTAFDNVPIHIPGEYMVVFAPQTYGNCDNVSGHSLDRVCREVAMLVKEFPDRLTMASTGGPVTGNDENDKRVWQLNTQKLERAGAMGIEFSLSCPQGGDGTKGDVVSQDAELTAKIIDWVMDVSDPEVPKLFKLTPAVTSIQPILDAVRNVFVRYPQKKAGVTLANSFPTLAFRERANAPWEEGVVVGMSGEGVLPISNLTLAKVANMGVPISGNGGPMDYKAAANFLALGAGTVQFCTIVMKYGLGVVDELHAGLSFLMESRGFTSVAELIGSARLKPITDFMDLSATKKIPTVARVLCEHCGNCTRCPYQAITLDRQHVPTFEAAKCVGCSLCAQKCFAGAIAMRPRTEKETAVCEHG